MRSERHGAGEITSGLIDEEPTDEADLEQTDEGGLEPEEAVPSMLAVPWVSSSGHGKLGAQAQDTNGSRCRLW